MSVGFNTTPPKGHQFQHFSLARDGTSATSDVGRPLEKAGGFYSLVPSVKSAACGPRRDCPKHTERPHEEKAY